MKHSKRVICLFLCALMLLSVFSGCAEETDEPLPTETVQVDFQLPDGAEYKIGDVISLPVPKVDREKLVRSLSVEVSNGGKVIATLTEDDTAYRFVNGGEHTFTYKLITSDKIETDSFTCNVAADDSMLIEWLPAYVGRFQTITVQDVYKEINGEQVKADLVITDPDNEQVNPENGVVSFDKEGIYTFTFSMKGAGGDTITEVKEVSTSLNTTDLFTFVSGGVSQEGAVSTPDGMGKFDNNYDNPGYVPIGANGLKLTFNGVGSIRFNNVIDLNELPADASLIELFVLPVTVPDYAGHVVGEELSPGDIQYPSGGYKHGTTNFTEFDIKLIDKYDSSNEILIHYFSQPTLSYWNWNEGYVSVGNSGLLQAINGSGSLLQGAYNNKNVGLLCNYSFYGEGDQPFNIRLDYATKRFYTFNNGKEQLVLDYDDVARLGAANVWNGFTTGECYLEISFPSVSADSSILITSIMGTSLSGMSPEDNAAPQLKVDAEDTLPVAQMGLAYKIPYATAFDAITGVCEVTTEVVDENGAPVSISDGAFVPDSVGSYTLTYTASDFYGNIATKTFTVNVQEKIADISVAPAATDLSFLAGVALMEPQFVIDGGSGEKTYSVKYVLEGEEIKPADGWLVLPKTGKLEIVFEISDYLQTCEKTLIYTVEAGDAPVLDDVVLPNALYVDKAYVFPSANAYDYKNQSVAQVRVAVNGMQLGNPTVYTPTQEDLAKGSITVVYTAFAGGKTVSKSYNVRIVEYSPASTVLTEGKDVEKAFFDRYATISASSNFGFSFAYAASINQFGLALGGVHGEDSFSTIKLTLIDAIDSKNQVTILLTKLSDSKMSIEVCGVEDTLTLPWVDYSNDNLASVSLTVEDGCVVLKSGNEVLYGSYPITNWDNGLKFTEFQSGGVYARVNVGGVVAKTTIKLFTFSGQSYNRFNIFASPQIAFSTAFKTATVTMDTRISIPTATGYSPVSYQVSARYEVIAPDGSVIVSGNGGDGGSFVCSEYGSYTVAWYLIDEVNNKTSTVNVVFNVFDRTAPVITVNSAAISGTVGSSVALPAAKVDDNVSKDKCILKVFVINPHNISADMTESMKFSPEMAGNYQIVYMAMDEAGNISVTKVDLHVKEGE